MLGFEKATEEDLRGMEQETAPSVGFGQGVKDFGESAAIGADQALTQFGRGVGTVADAINQATGAFDESNEGPGWDSESLANESNYKRRLREREAKQQKENLGKIQDSNWKTAGNLTGQIAPHLALGITGGVPGLIAGSGVGGLQTTGDIMLERSEKGEGDRDPWSAIAAGGADTVTSIATGGLLSKFGGNKLRDNILRNATEGGSTTALAEGYTNLAQDRDFTENMANAALAGAALGGGITAAVEVPKAIKDVDFTNYKPTQSLGKMIGGMRNKDFNISPELEDAATREVMNSAEFDVDVDNFYKGKGDKSAEDIADAAVDRELDSEGYGNIIRAADLAKQVGIPFTARSLDVKLPNGVNLGEALGITPRQIKAAETATEGARAGQLFDISSKPLTSEQHRLEVQENGRKAIEVIEQDFMDKRNKINDLWIDVKNKHDNRDPNVTRKDLDRLANIRKDMDVLINNIKSIRSKSHSGNIDLESFSSSSRRILADSLKVPGLDLKGRDGGKWNPARDIRDLDILDRMLTAEYPAWKEGTPNPAKQREVDKTMTDPMRMAAGFYTSGFSNAAESLQRANRRRQLENERTDHSNRLSELASLAAKAKANRGDYEGANAEEADISDVELNNSGIETGPSVMDVPLESETKAQDLVQENVTTDPVVQDISPEVTEAPVTRGEGVDSAMLRQPEKDLPEPVQEPVTEEPVIPGSDSEALTGKVDKSLPPKEPEVNPLSQEVNDLKELTAELRAQANTPKPEPVVDTSTADMADMEGKIKSAQEAEALRVLEEENAANEKAEAEAAAKAEEEALERQKSFEEMKDFTEAERLAELSKRNEIGETPEVAEVEETVTVPEAETKEPEELDTLLAELASKVAKKNEDLPEVDTTDTTDTVSEPVAEPFEETKPEKVKLSEDLTEDITRTNDLPLREPSKEVAKEEPEVVDTEADESPVVDRVPGKDSADIVTAPKKLSPKVEPKEEVISPESSEESLHEESYTKEEESSESASTKEDDKEEVKSKPLPTTKPDGFNVEEPKVEQFRAPIRETVESLHTEYTSRLSDAFDLSDKELSKKVLNAIHDLESKGKHIDDVTEGRVKSWVRDSIALDEIAKNESANKEVKKVVNKIIKLPSINNEFSVKQALLDEGVDSKYLSDDLIRKLVNNPDDISNSQVQRIRKAVYDAMGADIEATRNIGFVKSIAASKGSQEQVQLAKDKSGIIDGKPVTDKQLEKFQSELATIVHKEALDAFKKQEAEAKKLADKINSEKSKEDAEVSKNTFRDANQLKSIISKLESNIRNLENTAIKQKGLIEQGDAEMARISKDLGLKDLQERMTNPRYRKEAAKVKTAKELLAKTESDLKSDTEKLEKAKGLRNFNDAFAKMIETEADMVDSLNFSKKIEGLGIDEVADELKVPADILKMKLKEKLGYNPNVSVEALQDALDGIVKDIYTKQKNSKKAISEEKDREVEKLLSEVPAEEIESVRSRLQDEVSRLAEEGKRQDSLRALAALGKIPAIDSRKYDPRTERLIKNESEVITKALERKLQYPDNPEFWVTTDDLKKIDTILGQSAASTNRGRWAQRIKEAVYGVSDYPVNQAEWKVKEDMQGVTPRSMEVSLAENITKNIKVSDDDMASMFDIVDKQASDKASKAEEAKQSRLEAIKRAAEKPKKAKPSKPALGDRKTVKPETKPEKVENKVVTKVESPAKVETKPKNAVKAPESTPVETNQEIDTDVPSDAVMRSEAALRRFIEEKIGYELDGSKVSKTIAGLVKSKDTSKVKQAIDVLKGKEESFGWVGKDGTVKQVKDASVEVEEDKQANLEKIKAALGERSPKQEGVDKAPVSDTESNEALESNVDETPEEAAARKEMEDTAKNVMKVRKAALKRSATEKAREFMKYKKEMGYDDDMDVIADMPELTLTPAEYAQAIEDGRKVKDAMVPDEEDPVLSESSGISDNANFSRDYLNEIAKTPMKMTDVMDSVSKNSPNSAFRAIANRVKSALRNDFEVSTEDTSIKFGGAEGVLIDNGHVPARMVLSKKLIDSGKDGDYESALLHEAVHSVTSSLINSYRNEDLRKQFTPSQKDAVERYNKLNQDIVSKLSDSGDAGLVELAKEFTDNPQELVSYGLTDQKVIDALKGFNVEFGGESVSGWDALKKSIMEFFGVKSGKVKTAFESLLDSFDELSEEQGVLSDRFISNNTMSDGTIDTGNSEKYVPRSSRGVLTAL
ncbi:MJ0042 family finger-like protein [Vibrio phage Vp_R1]|uniref:MJ0042 family finger-like protein n=1 Tax=Vibrio phage Vp_R1 TaxID=2059867 RepID=A0A2H5BQA3_9CAUD|nr:MJ0042 family finger-like protein [Vibrio phage Vp_R1]AUG88495.1 MJ0042 family finger-like protein [Vibrio phage Vp_R1]